MSLERKPADPEQDPGYPNSQEYSTQRRTFLTLIGAAAVGGLMGLISYAAPGADNPGKVEGPRKPVTNPAPIVPAKPQAMPLGEPPVAPQVETPGRTSTQITPPEATPRAAPPGVVAPVQAPVKTPDPAQPKAIPLGGPGPVPAKPITPAKGDVAPVELPPAPANPDVNIRGGSGKVVHIDPTRGQA
jgi:hypothetical protein